MVSGGCYYTHLAVGQSRLLLARESLQKVIEDPSTPPSVRHRLNVVVEVLEFGNELGLNVGKRYRQFVDWPGDRIITAVMATKRNTMEQHQFKFPLVGALPFFLWRASWSVFVPPRAQPEGGR